MRQDLRVRRSRGLPGEVTVPSGQRSAHPADPRLDVSAKFALKRMLRADPASRIAAAGIIDAVNAGLLAGVFGDDLLAAAKLAGRLGTVRWKLVPPGEDAVSYEILVRPSVPRRPSSSEGEKGSLPTTVCGGSGPASTPLCGRRGHPSPL